MTDQSPNAQATPPVPAAPRKAVDWDNIVAFVGAIAMAFGIMYFKPEGPALAEAGSVVGGCLLYIQRRSS